MCKYACLSYYSKMWPPWEGAMPYVVLSPLCPLQCFTRSGECFYCDSMKCVGCLVLLMNGEEEHVQSEPTAWGERKCHLPECVSTLMGLGRRSPDYLMKSVLVKGTGFFTEPSDGDWRVRFCHIAILFISWYLEFPQRPFRLQCSVS